MGFNSTVMLTVALLTMMFGAGFVSSSYGYKLGRAALKEITQPDVRPNNLSGQKKTLTRKTEVKLLQEKDILTNVKKVMEGKDVEPVAKTASNNKPAQKPTPEAQKAETKPTAADKSRFPIVSRDGGVTLEVTSARRNSNSLLLDVSLKNEGNQSIRFLYSFLNVADDKGRALSASVEDLPGQLEPNRSAYTGTVSIPTALLENAKELSMSLTDYPDQKLQLKLSGIPVVE